MADVDTVASQPALGGALTNAEGNDGMVLKDSDERLLARERR